MVSKNFVMRTGIVAVGVLLMAGCSGESEEAGPTSIEAQVRALAATQSELGNTSQAKILEDGIVTDAEYRQATSDARECMISEGLEVSEIEKWLDLEGYSLSFEYEPGARSPEDGQTAADACETAHLEGVATGWARQKAHLLSPEGKTLLAACYEENGVDFPDAESLEKLRNETPDDASETWAKCVGEANDKINE